MSDYEVKIQVSTPGDPEAFFGRSYYRVHLLVTDATNLPQEIFVHQRVAGWQGSHDEFIGVAGPLDLVNIPEQVPVEGGKFRKAEVDLLIESVSLANQTVKTIQRSVQHLLRGLRQLETLTPTQIITVQA